MASPAATMNFASLQDSLRSLQNDFSNTTAAQKLSALSFTSAIEAIQENPRFYFLLITGFVTLFTVEYLRSPYRKLPPGPKGLPIIGPAFELTSPGHLWIKFTAWRGTYGDLVHLPLPGHRIIVINSQKAANEILERHAGKNSDRPRSIVAAEILTGGLLFVFTRYNDVWRRMRKAAHGGLNKQVANRYQPTQLTEAVLLAAGVLTHPKEWVAHLRRSSASTIMSVVYDTPPIASEQDPAVKDVNDFVARLTRAGLPGAHLVEFFPWMMYIPSRFAKWKREAEEWYAKDSTMFSNLYNAVRDRLAEGEERFSLTASLIEDSERANLSDHENTWVAATMYAAGSETTGGVMTWWMLAMVAFPEVQKRAQAEIDAVVGRERLPTFADLPNLPYIQAMVKETLRWRPVDPLGMPHYTIEDDWYEGMYIPKDTILIANVWHMNRDPEIYGPDAAQFNPARYLNEKGELEEAAKGEGVAKEEGHVTYGFGRRICVGRHVSNNSLFIDIAMMLWAMNIEKADDGKPLDVEGCVDDGLVVRPIYFDCKVSPRAPDVLSILEEERAILLNQ